MQLHGVLGPRASQASPTGQSREVCLAGLININLTAHWLSGMLSTHALNWRGQASYSKCLFGSSKWAYDLDVQLWSAPDAAGYMEVARCEIAVAEQQIVRFAEGRLQSASLQRDDPSWKSRQSPAWRKMKDVGLSGVQASPKT